MCVNCNSRSIVPWHLIPVHCGIIFSCFMIPTHPVCPDLNCLPVGKLSTGSGPTFHPGNSMLQ